MLLCKIKGERKRIKEVEICTRILIAKLTFSYFILHLKLMIMHSEYFKRLAHDSRDNCMYL